MSWKEGIVQWWDEVAGKGVIIDKENGTTYFVHHSRIQSTKTEKKLEKGKPVKYTLYENIFSKRVDKVTEC